MKLKTISVQFTNGLIYDTDGFELEFEKCRNTLNETILTINGGSLSDLIRYLFSKGFDNTSVIIPIMIVSEKIIVKLNHCIGGYVIEYR